MWGGLIEPPQPGRRRRKGPAGRRRDTAPAPRLGRLLGAYLCGWAIVLACLLVPAPLGPVLGIVAYGGCGIHLSRRISGEFAWNSNFATLAGVASAKLALAAAWPVQVPRLIWQAFVAKVL